MLYIKSILSVTLLTTIFFISCKKEGKNTNLTIDPSILNLPTSPFNYQNIDFPEQIDSIFKYSEDWDNTPNNNPITNDGATLGRVLFYDKILSSNGEISCASCHDINKSFADPNQFSTGVNGTTPRNSMSLTNLRFWAPKKMFWDLRANSLEEQVTMPILDHLEMGNDEFDNVIKRLNNTSYYPILFSKAFGSANISKEGVSKALSQFIRSIVSFNSKYDEGLKNNFNNFSQSETNGMNLFLSRCSECHIGNVQSTDVNKKLVSFLRITAQKDQDPATSGFGSNENNGLDIDYLDKGIGKFDPMADGFFKMPMLRNIELTAPYMHDGRFKTLEEVINFYSTGVQRHPRKGIQIPDAGFQFNNQEKQDIVAFLKTLTDHTLAQNPMYTTPFVK